MQSFGNIVLSVFLTLVVFNSTPGIAADTIPAVQLLIKNVPVWDGTSNGVTKRINVLVENNLIKKLRASDTDANSDAKVIAACARNPNDSRISWHL